MYSKGPTRGSLQQPLNQDGTPRLMIVGRRRHRTFAQPLAALVVLILIGGVVTLLVRNDQDQSGRRSRSATGPTTAKTNTRTTASATTAPATTAPATTTPAPTPTGIPGNWHLILNSEFNGTSLPADWRTGWFGTGVTDPVNTAEDACYSPANVSFPGDGSVQLSVTATASSCSAGHKQFTAAILTTNPEDGRTTAGFQYRYGVLESRVYLPGDAGLVADWPAIWTDGQDWPEDGEDDIAEGLDGTICWHFHAPDAAPGACSPTLRPGWHTVASNWEPGSVTYYYDGKEVAEITTNVTSAPMYIVLDMTTHAGGVPASLRVKYVRVWQSR